MKANVVICTVEKIETHRPQCPSVIKLTDIPTQYPHAWTIGNLDILSRNLMGFFCSVKCPGNIILKTYDLARSFRDAGITLISGFHSPIEKDVLGFLLNGSQPLVVCPARSIENMRIPKDWQEDRDNGRLLLLSFFEKKDRRITAALSEQRNRIVALLARDVFIPYAAPGSRSETLCRDIIKGGKTVFTINDDTNGSLIAMGAELIRAGPKQPTVISDK